MALIKMDEKVFRKNKKPQINKAYVFRVLAAKKSGPCKGQTEKWLGRFEDSDRLVKYIREITKRGIVFHFPGCPKYFHPNEIKEMTITFE